MKDFVYNSRAENSVDLSKKDIVSYQNNLGNSIAFLGDSLTMGQAVLPYTPTFPNMWVQSSGFSYVANILLKQRLAHKGLFGHSGYTARQILEGGYVDLVIASNPSFCVVLAGTNDQYGSDDISVVKDSLSKIYNQLLNAGIKVIGTTLPPQTFSSNTATKQKRAAINNFVKDTVFNTANMYLFDLARATSDNTGDALVSGYSDDTLHLNALGGQHAGWELYNTLLNITAAKNRLICTVNDTSNLLTNNTLFLIDSTSDGKADGWVFVAGTGATPTIVSRTDGEPGKWQQIVQTGGTTYLAQSAGAPGTTYNIGDKVRAMIEFEIDPASTSAELQLDLLFNGLSSANTTQEYKSVYNFNHSGVLQTYPVAVPVGCTSISLQVLTKGNITVRYARPKIEIVT